MSHPLQSPAWGEFRQAMGIDVERLNKWLITFHKVPYTPWTIGYFPKGPLPNSRMIESLKTIGKQKNAIFIQLEPNETKGAVPLKTAHHPLFTKYTFMLDLTKSEEDLLAAMHPKTRYNIRVAQKHGVSVTEDNSQEAFDAYLKLSEETTARQGFYAHNQLYHKTMWKILHNAGIAHLFVARHQNEVLAAWIVFVWEDTVYYPYGASSRLHREVMAPNLMLWEIVRWAKARNLKRFDLWGAMGPPSADGPSASRRTNDPWYGFHRFKEGFRPELVEYVGSFDLVINPILYTLYTIADTLRWSILKLKKR